MVIKCLMLWRWWGFRLLLAAGLVGWVIGRQDLMALRAVLARFDPVVGLAMLGVNGALLGLFALRWRSVAGLFGIVAPLRQFVRVVWLSAALGECGPPLLVGELARFHLMRSFGSRRRILGGQIADRVSGYAVLLATVALFSPVYVIGFGSAELVNAVAFGGAVACGVVAMVLVGRRRKAARTSSFRWGRFRVAVVGLMRSPGHYVYSALIQMLLSVNILLAAVGLGVADDPLTIVASAPLLLLGVSVLPSVWSDWGKREAVAVLVLAPAGLSSEQALAVSLVFGLGYSLAVLPGWWWFPRRAGH